MSERAFQEGRVKGPFEGVFTNLPLKCDCIGAYGAAPSAPSPSCAEPGPSPAPRGSPAVPKLGITRMLAKTSFNCYWAASR